MAATNSLMLNKYGSSIRLISKVTPCNALWITPEGLHALLPRAHLWSSRAAEKGIYSAFIALPNYFVAMF